MDLKIERQASTKFDRVHGIPAPVVDVRIPCEADQCWTIWGLFDVHLDCQACATDNLRRDIEAIKADPFARVIIGGDWNNLIFKQDKRYDEKALRDDMKSRQDCATYIHEMNMDYLSPIADKIDLYISGNHEEGFCHRVFPQNFAMSTAAALNVPYRSYFSLLRYFFTASNGSTARSRGWVHHGFGSNAPVTKGMISLTRLAEQNRYDWNAIGHIHQQTFNNSISLDDIGAYGFGELYPAPIASMVGGTYQMNYMGGEAGYEARKAFAPVRIGPGKMRLYTRRRSSGALYIEPNINY